jgi:predicted MFS family arabinose efflux permease
MIDGESGDNNASGQAYLSKGQVLFLAVASAVVTANAYYIHPIISLVADDFGIGEGMIGIVPAMNQIALALGIFLLLPLGDMVSNKRLTAVSVAAQTVGVAAMAFAPGFSVFLIASTLLGFVTVAPYLLPTYASKRVAPGELGYVTAVLTTGIIIGILLARTGAGVLSEYMNWRVVYMIAAGLMLAVTIALPLVMDSGERSKERVSAQRYFALIGSIPPLVKRYPEVIVSGAIQGLGFGSFLAIWMGLGLHLPSAEMGYGTDTVGYLALLALVSMVTTPRFGKWADRIGARQARLYLAAAQVSAMVMFVFAGHSLWLLVVPIVMTNMFGPSIDVTGRMTFLSEAADIRTRLMTVYIVLMFIGGGFGSWVGTASYAWGGWNATAIVALVMASTILALSVYSYRRWGRGQEEI